MQITAGRKSSGKHDFVNVDCAKCPRSPFLDNRVGEGTLSRWLRPPLKLHVNVSCMQLSRRLSDARMQEKVLSRATGQARTRRTTWSRAAVSSLRCANVVTDATRFGAGSNRRDVRRVFGPGAFVILAPTPQERIQLRNQLLRARFVVRTRRRSRRSDVQT